MSGEELPEDLKHLIEESVQDVAEPPEITKLKNESVKGSQLLEFVNIVIGKLEDSNVLTKLRADLDSNEAAKDPQERLNCVKQLLEKYYDNIWLSLNVRIELGQRAVTGIPAILQDSGIEAEFRQNLSTAFVKYKELEGNTVGRLMFGDEAFKKRQEEQKVVFERKKKLEKEFSSLTNVEKGQKVKELKEKAFALRKKLMSMGGSAAAKYLRELKEEEASVMLELSALAMMIQEGATNLPAGLGPPQAKKCCDKH